MVDGYDAESQVEELATREFYADCRARLTPRRGLVVNLWGGDRQFNDVLQRIEAVFPDGTLCLPARKPGNVIAFAFRDAPGPLRWDDLDRACRGTGGALWAGVSAVCRRLAHDESLRRRAACTPEIRARVSGLSMPGDL